MIIEIGFIQIFLIFSILMLLVSVSENFSMVALTSGLNLMVIIYLLGNLDFTNILNIFWILLFMSSVAYSAVRFMILKDGGLDYGE